MSLFERIANFFGYRVEYVCDWGVWTRRYTSIDFAMNRPVHRHMSVAPPWAKARLVRLNLTKDKP